MKKLKLLDTFAGIGGFSYAAEKIVRGYETTQFIEINPFSQKILKKHWPHVPIHDDIKTFTAKSGKFDIITGGFPCQDISVAGLQKGITEETRSGLFFELMRVIRMVRPKYVVLENVAAILNRGLDIVLRELSEAGYDAEWSVIRASFVGACHKRSRWWLIAYPNSKQSSKPKSEIQSRRNSSSSSNRQRNVTNSYSKGMERRKFTINEKMQKTGFTWQSYTPHLSPEWRSYVSEPCLCRGDDGLRGRMDRLKALGNAVVPQVAAIPMQRILDIEKNINK
jgi:DNA (cytosine-5)-methyltransferase 1